MKVASIVFSSLLSSVASLCAGIFDKDGQCETAAGVKTADDSKEIPLEIDPDDHTLSTTNDDEEDAPFKIDPDASILDYLNPDLLADPEIMKDVGERLRRGELVVIRDAFIEEFADHVWDELDELPDSVWKLHQAYLADGFSFSHHNIYDEEDYTEVLNATRGVFFHPESIKFMENLTGRDCSGVGQASASYYQPNDYSLPHTDNIYSRTVAFVWHLSYEWLPEWGGALFWIPGDEFIEASYNTLHLFDVNGRSNHFVTHVSPHAKQKRLTFNGWWFSSDLPTLEDPLEEQFATKEQRRKLSYDQAAEILYMDMNWENDPNRRRQLKRLQYDLGLEMYSNPAARKYHIIDLYEEEEDYTRYN